MSIEQSVLAMGAGKATAMHAGVWSDLGWHVSAHDVNPARLEESAMQEDFRRQFDLGNVAVLHSLAGLSLAQTPPVFDIATSSGSHTAALEQALDATSEAPRAVLIEKPLDAFDSLRSLLQGELDESKVFVNENYNASAAVTHMLALVAQEKAAGNNVRKIFVNFDKNRIPDVVQAGRFTDKELGAYGIEMPHMLAVATNLAGTTPQERPKIQTNRYGVHVDGIDNNEYTYTRLQTADGTDIILAQGLGPFRMDEQGRRTPYEFQKGEAIRTATVTFDDGRKATATFAPVPDLPKFHSRVEWSDRNGDPQSRVFEDNTLRRVIELTATCALTGERPALTESLSVEAGLAYAFLLHHLHGTSDWRTD